jgi:mannosyltransferase OCH1-like enzyme
MSIPKIIHHIAPSDKSQWHLLWIDCNDSWIQNFSDFEHMYWDICDLDNFVNTYFPEYYEVYNDFPLNILKFDFCRPLLLYQYGGIYADMDMFCYKNFYDILQKNICLLGDYMKYGNVTIGNALMCSTPKEKFWISCIELILSYYKYFKKRNIFKNKIQLYKTDNNLVNRLEAFAVLKMGPQSIAEVINSDNNLLNGIQLLESILFDSDYLEYKDYFYTKHLYSGTWDKNYIESKNKQIYSSEHYKMLRNVDIDYIRRDIIRTKL